MAIKIRVSFQKGYIWDVNDVEELRVKHHICGTLTGSLPQVGQQNLFLGLPLLLLPEEVVLLVRNNLATLVDDVRAHPPTTRSQADSYEAMRNKAIEAQQTETARRDEEKKAEMQLVYKDKIIKKIQDKQALALARGKPPLLGDEQDTGIKVVEPGQDTAWTEPPLPPPKPRDLSAIPYIIVIQPSSTDAPWYNPSAATYTTLAAAREAQVWNYPSTKLEEARCKVFEDLWKKGHFMGGGLRFGGDFLIYPGDPLRYHSHFTLTVIPSLDTPIMPLDLVAYGRLATAVKKAHLLGTWDEKEEKAEYLSLEWAAFG